MIPQSRISMGSPRVVGRYALYGVLASGGMAKVHLGRLHGASGFSRTVAIKRLLQQYTGDSDFVAMFLEEARLASRIHHPNVVPVIDVISADGELLLVMEYIEGETLSRLIRTLMEHGEDIPIPIVASIMCDALDGLHAAHEAVDNDGRPLGIVHRDVSPQNIIVGSDGTARVLDFGIAKAVGRAQITREGQLKGKLAYMSPQQLEGNVSRSTDIYAAGIVLWEALATKRLFAADNEGETVAKILASHIEPPSWRSARVPPAYDEVALKALARDTQKRYASAREMSLALAKAGPRAEPHEVGAWVAETAKGALEERHDLHSRVETAVTHTPGLARESTSSRGGGAWRVALGAGLVLFGVGVAFSIAHRAGPSSTGAASVSSVPTATALPDGGIAISLGPGPSSASASAPNAKRPPPAARTAGGGTGPPPGNAGPSATKGTKLPEFL